MTTLATLALSADERERARRIREVAARGETAVSELVAQLDDPSWAVRRAVVAALAAMGEPAIRSLTDIVSDRRQSEGRLAAAVDALVLSRGNADVAALTLAESSTRAVVCDAAQILGRRRYAASVPKLALLTTDSDDNVALSAIEALGRIDSDAAITPLIAALESRSFFRAFPAIDVLGRSGNPRAVRPLIAALEEPHYAVEAARALGRIGEPAAIGPLASLLGKPTDAVVRAAAVAIVEIHDRQRERFGVEEDKGGLARFELRAATRRLVQTLNHADPNEQAALLRILGWIGGDVAVVALVDTLAADPVAAQTAATALVRLGAAAEPHLLEALRAGDSERRLVILPLLRHKTAAAGPLADCLSDVNPAVRALACDALARIGEVRVVPQLFALLADRDARVTQSALAAIQSLGSTETEQLALEAARSSDGRVRRAGLRIIAYFAYPSGVDALLQATGDEDERIRDAAILGVPLLDDPRAVEALVVAAAHVSPRTRAAAVRALGQAPKQPSTLLALRIGLRDPDPWVRYFACQALSRVKDESAADLIATLIADPAGQVRVAVVEALAQLRGVRAIDALHAAACGDDADVRRAAILGLGHVKDPSSLPILRLAMRDGDAATRLVTLSAIAEYPGDEIARDLGNALGDADESVRSAAISLLSTRPGPTATHVLTAHLSNVSLQSRIVAALALTVPGRIEALAEALEVATVTAPSIVSALSRSGRAEAAIVLENAFGSPEAAVRRAVAPALARIGTGTARARLEQAASHDPDEIVRQLSAAALQR